MANRLDGLLGLIEAARGGSADAFAALCLRNAQGRIIDLEAFHRTIHAFIDYCWRQTPPVACGILAPWRHGKSLLGIIGRTALAVGLNPEIRTRIICADDREAVLRVAAIRRLVESRRYRRIFPGVKPRAGEWLKQQFTVERASLAPDPTVSAAGIFSVEAGGGHDLLMFDDIVTYQNTYLTPAMRPMIYTTLTSVWLRRIDPGTRILCVGTAWHHDDAYHRLQRAEQAAHWRWLIISVAQDFTTLEARVV